MEPTPCLELEHHPGDASSQAISTDGGTTWFSPSGLTPGAYAVFGTAAAVPEPSTLVLLSSGVVGLLGSRWRRRPTAHQAADHKSTAGRATEDRVVLSTTFTWTMAPSPAVGGGTMLQYPNGTIMEVGGLVYTGSGFSYQGGESNLWQVFAPAARVATPITHKHHPTT